MVQPAPGGLPDGARPEGVAPAPVLVKVPLFSPLGYIIVFIIMLIEGVLVYMIAGFLHSGTTAGPGKAGADVVQVLQLDLDVLKVPFDVPDPANPEMIQSRLLIVRPVISFEKGKEGVDEAFRYANTIKADLRDTIRTMLKAKGYRPLKQPNVMEEVKLDIKDRVNQELKAQVVKKVVFSDEEWN